MKAYDLNLKIIGKLAKLFDVSAIDVTSQNTLFTNFVQQYAVQDLIALDLLFPASTARWNVAVNTQPPLQVVAIAAATAYIQSATFTGDLTTSPASGSVQDILTAFAADTVTDEVTLTTKAATGIVNFLDVIRGAAGTWNTAADASATFKDSVYCISAVV